MGNRWVWGAAFGLATAASAADRPAELPPEGFRAGQYIDSTGCVFVRSGDNPWQPRLARDGSAICGYPPTRDALRQGTARLPALAGTDPRHEMAAALGAVIATGVQDGLVRADPATKPTEPVHLHLPPVVEKESAGHGEKPVKEAATDAHGAAEPSADQPTEIRIASRATAQERTAEQVADNPVTRLDALVRAAPVLRAAAADPVPRQRELCRSLGGDVGREGSFGQSETLGFCSLKPIRLGKIPVAATNPPANEPHVSGPAKATGAVTTAAKPKATKVAQPATNSKERLARTKPAAQLPQAKSPAVAGVILPGHRFVQVGTYANAENAVRTVARTKAMGVPVLTTTESLRGAAHHVVMAGPFSDREQIVSTLAKLRAAGYRDAFTR